MHAPGRFNRSYLGALIIAATTLVGCSEDNLAPKMIPTPSGPMASMGSMIVDVNLKTGKITTTPVTSGSLRIPSGMSAKIYGSFPSVGHVFQLETGAPIGNAFILRDHVENLQPFPIGTNVPHATGAFPRDTMGVYVFLSLAPVVTAGCSAGPTCTVTLDTAYDGEFSFTDLDQPYMFFKTILEANDNNLNAGLDFTDQSARTGGTGIDYFRKFGFHTTGGVTNFKFGVSVSAAWVKPHDTQWTVNYAGDSFPNRVGTSLADLRSEPDWRVVGSTVADTSELSSLFLCASAQNCFIIQHAAPASGVTDSLLYYRSDSLGQADTAFINATLSASNLKNGNPSVYIGMQDPVKWIAFGIAADKVGFVSGANTFLTSSIASASTNLSTVFMVSKFGTDSVVGYVNGVPKASVLYSALPNIVASNPPKNFWFGNRVTFNSSANPTNVTSRWSSVIYTIGASGP